MGNCSNVDKSDSYKKEKVNIFSFIRQYPIGKGGFGRVTFFNFNRYGK